MPAETDPINVRITASMMKFETQMPAMTWSTAKSASQTKKSLSGIDKASGFAQMSQLASRS